MANLAADPGAGMSAIEINKIVGAVLFALLVFTAINVGFDEFFHEQSMEATAYPAPAGAEQEETVAAAATGEPAAAEPSFAALLAGADLDKGKKVAKKCAACHDFAPGGRNKVGPALWGIVGAEIAARDGFKYSQALSGLGGRWGYDELGAFLAAPKTYAPGTKMTFAGVKDAAKRADLVAYLRSLADDPPPLPAAE
ncbi:MAG: cytochrome c family protein [Alphaproteobacteria bacterium]